MALRGFEVAVVGGGVAGLAAATALAEAGKRVLVLEARGELGGRATAFVDRETGELVDNGLLEREDYRDPGQRTRQRYRLTDKGADLFPALVGLMEWGDRWLDDRGGPVELRHRDCGETVATELRCAAGHTVSVDELDLAARRRPHR